MFKNDQFDGCGINVNFEGDVYDGDFQEGQRHGIGKLTQERDTFKLLYIGELKNGLYDGSGQLEVLFTDQIPSLNSLVRVENKEYYNGGF